MMTLAPQPWMRETGRRLQAWSRVLASLVADVLVLVGGWACLAAPWLVGLATLPPRDRAGWVLLLAAALPALATLAVVVRYLWWDARTVVVRRRADARRGDGDAGGRPVATPGVQLRLLALARSRDVLPLERPARQAARVLAARVGLLVAVVLGTLVLLATLLLVVWLGRLVVANFGAVVLAVAVLALLALIMRELRVLRRLLGADIREAEALLVRQVPDLQRAQLRLLGELKTEGQRLAEAREHLAAFGSPEARLLVDRVGDAAGRIAGVSRDITLAVGHVQETVRTLDRRAQEANRVTQALVTAMADHVSNFDRAAGAMAEAAQGVTTALATGQAQATNGMAGNGHAPSLSVARRGDDRRARSSIAPPSALADGVAHHAPDAPDQVAIRHDLALLLARRFAQGGDLACAVEAVQHFERALALCPAQAAGRGSIGHDLAKLYRAMYERTGDDEYGQAAQRLLSDLLHQA